MSTETESLISQSLESDGSTYDALPYPSKFFLQTHPDRLATAAILYGMEPTPVRGCRVLDIGCGNGSNLIAQAYGLPHAEFVGIDLSQKHIEKANASAAELGLTNVTFRRMDVMDVTAREFGAFGYIAAHGLFAWVPEFVRHRVLELCAEMLAANGVGYISYNAYPGAYARQMVRSMMTYHAGEITDPAEKVARAMGLLELLARNSTGRDIHGRILEHELKRHREHLAADIFHDELGEVYRPFFFHEFASLLKSHGLQFLSEAEIHASGTQGLSEDAVRSLNDIDDRIAREQYLDFFRGRVFRQTLFCRGDLEIRDRPKPASLDRLYLSSSLQPVDKIRELSSPRIEKFRSAKGQQIQIDHPLTKAALVCLGEAWGRSVATSDLIELARDRLAKTGVEVTEAMSETTRNILLQIALAGDMIELHSYAPQAPAVAAERPRVNRLARWQLKDANNVLTLLNKDLKLNDKISRRLVEFMDGTRTRSELERELQPFIEQVDDLSEKEKSELRRNLTNWIDDSIKDLARLGLFEA